MKKNLTLALLAASMLAMPMAAHANDHEGGPRHEMHEKYKNMSPEERKAHFEQKRAEWEAMSKEEKVQKIEQKRAEKLKYMEEKWNGMTDDQKIEHVENKMKRWKERAGKHGQRSLPEAKTAPTAPAGE